MGIQRIGGFRLLRNADEAIASTAGILSTINGAATMELEVESPFGFRLRGSLSNDVIRHFLIGTGPDSPYEYPLLFVLWAATGVGGTFLDIGANLGYHSLAVWKNASAEILIHAFEPMPTFSRQLQQNIRRNGAEAAIHVHPFALSHQDGETTFYLLGTASSLEADWSNAIFGISKQPEISVPVRRLDEVLDVDRLAEPIVVKIDVEGHEAAVLDGGSRLFRSEKTTTLVVESDPRAGKVEEVHALLAGWGYRLFGLSPTPADRELPGLYRPPFRPAEQQNSGAWSTNVWLAVRWDHPAVQRWWDRWKLYPWFVAARWMSQAALVRRVVRWNQQHQRLVR